jgi:trk system potassium uptake protein TrkA
MKIIVLGCGRVGSQVSLLLAQSGHFVTVIDHQQPDAAARLGENFKGRLVRGIGFDRNVLLEAGIEQADAFVAASPSDNANIVAARMAHNIFRVPRVVARLYDPRRAEIYKRLGLKTISTTTWGAERIFELITHTDLDVIYTFGRGEVSIVNIEIPHNLVGRQVKDLLVPGEVSIISITRDDMAFVPASGSEFKEGDLLHLALLSSAMEKVEEMLGLERRL